MKVTIDIADDIWLRAKELARERNTTLRSLVEEGLVEILEELDVNYGDGSDRL